MRKIIDRLLALQKLQFAAGGPSAVAPAEVEALRAEVPPPILAHYERLVARGKKGVALVRNGVCSECHLRITGGKLIHLTTTPDEVHLCDNCGRYLYQPEAAPAGLTDVKTAAPAKAKRTRKPVAQHVG